MDNAKHKNVFCLLSFYELCLEAVAHACGVCIVGIDVHFEAEILVHSDLHVVEEASSFAGKLDVDVLVITHAEGSALILAHMDMAVCYNASLAQRNDALRSDYGYGG